MTKRYYKCEETHRTFRGVKLKRCTKCKRWKEESEFPKDRARKDGLRIYCKGCNIAYGRKHYRKNRKTRKAVRDYLRYEERHRTVRGFRQKLCSCCKKWKTESNFGKDRRSRDGLGFWCKECGRKRSGQNRKTGRRYLRYEERHRALNKVKQKLCNKCGRWKSEINFAKDRTAKDGLSCWCKECGRKRYRRNRKNRKAIRDYLRYEERHRTVRGFRQKLCSCCKKWKAESDFGKDRRSRDGLGFWCKECGRKRSGQNRKTGRRYLRYEERHRALNKVKQKLCNKCGRWKSESEFYKDRSKRDGLHARCKKCSYKAVKKPRKGVAK